MTTTTTRPMRHLAAFAAVAMCAIMAPVAQRDR